jgi:aminoglycoside phosphotransferase family enzyme/predicted kinase
MLPPLIEALHNPACYPHPIDTSIKVIETQVSWVILTGDYVYKVKKQLDFGFLDFSTLEKRQFYCEEELRLNQRLAPDIYQAVVTISGSIENPVIGNDDYRLTQQETTNTSEFISGNTKLKNAIASTELAAEDTPHTDDQTIEITDNSASTVLEYAVRMQQFDPTDGLDKLLQCNQFDPSWINPLAQQLAQFHLCLPTITSNSPWGEPENIWQLVSDNFTHTLNFYKDSQDSQQIALLYEQTTSQFIQLKDLLSDRRRQGFIRECHGDLHLGNITCYKNELRLFDCIEFNLQFRWIDTCSDLAFLLMDLEANDRYSWANIALNRYLEITGDFQALALLNFYKSFRAMVRAKIATFGEQADHGTFIKYLELTQSYQTKSPPKLIIMHGLSGSGKSHISEQITKSSPTIRLRSETERNRLHKELQKKGKNLQLHSPEINARLSQHLISLTEQVISLGYSVIVDGTFLKQHFRQKYIDVAQKFSIDICILSCQCNEKLMEARLVKGINTRSNDSNFSLDRLAHQRSYQQPLSDQELLLQQQVDTDDDEAINNLILQFKQFDE